MSSMYSNQVAAAALCAAVGTGYYSGFDVAIAASTPKITTYQPNTVGYQQLRDKFARFKAVADALSQ